jgi:hypothetical protein
MPHMLDIVEKIGADESRPCGANVRINIKKDSDQKNMNTPMP